MGSNLLILLTHLCENSVNSRRLHQSLKADFSGAGEGLGAVGRAQKDVLVAVCFGISSPEQVRDRSLRVPRVRKGYCVGRVYAVSKEAISSAAFPSKLWLFSCGPCSRAFSSSLAAASSRSVSSGMSYRRNTDAVLWPPIFMAKDSVPPRLRRLCAPVRREIGDN
jgi:hypothetical protein